MKNSNKILNNGIKIAKNTAMAVGIYTGILLMAQGISQELMSPRINNQNQLEQILNRERKRAGINDNIIIDAKLSYDKEEGSYSQRYYKGSYRIVLSPDRFSPKGSNLATLRHELYHIADGHCDDPKRFNYSKFQKELIYLFIHEPQATIYQITGLKP